MHIKCLLLLIFLFLFFPFRFLLPFLNIPPLLHHLPILPNTPHQLPPNLHKIPFPEFHKLLPLPPPHPSKRCFQRKRLPTTKFSPNNSPCGFFLILWDFKATILKWKHPAFRKYPWDKFTSPVFNSLSFSLRTIHKRIRFNRMSMAIHKYL